MTSRLSRGISIRNADTTRASVTRGVFFIILYGIALNHTNVIFGVNASISDAFVILILGGAIFSGGAILPRIPVALFLVLSIVTLSVAVFVAPTWVPTGVPLGAILTDYLKLSASFLSFVLGIQLVRWNKVQIALGAFAFGSAAIASWALIGEIFPPLGPPVAMYYADFRFRGLMNDPNYYAVLTVAALAVVWRLPSLKTRFKWAATVPLVGGILLSGSKTGALVMTLWLLVALLVPLSDRGPKGGPSPSMIWRIYLSGIVAAITALVLVNRGTKSWIEEFLLQLPATARIAPIFSDFNLAVSDGGSTRDQAWDNAWQLIQLSPIVGVGVGSYLPVNSNVNGGQVLAHNTFLQLGAEWGTILASLLFAWLGYCIVVRPRGKEDVVRQTWGIGVAAQMVILVGSLGLSLNNARLFWLLCGIVGALHLLRVDEPNETRRRDEPTYLGRK